MAESGLLSVDEPVCSHLPACPPAWEEVTVHHLLTHTSGMADFVELPDYESTTNRPPPPSGLIARADDRPLQFEPGAAWRYSNSGYAVLGYLIGQVSGHPYRAFIEENIFDVLHMDDSGYDPRQEVIATGYVGTGDQ